MRAKEERNQREELKAILKLLQKNFQTEQNQCLYEISKKYMIILRKEYASEAGVGGMKKVKNPLNFS